MDAYPIVFTDDFSSGALGSSWDAQAGTFSVDTGFSPARVSDYVGGATLSYATVSPSTYAFPTDQQASCYANVLSVGTTLVGPVVRGSAAGCYFAAKQASPLRWCIYKYQAGTLTALYLVSISLSSTTRWTLRAEGTRLSLFIVESGVEVFCGGVNDSTFATGQPGIGQFGVYDANAYISQFSARIAPIIPA